MPAAYSDMLAARGRLLPDLVEHRERHGAAAHAKTFAGQRRSRASSTMNIAEMSGAVSTSKHLLAACAAGTSSSPVR